MIVFSAPSNTFSEAYAECKDRPSCSLPVAGVSEKSIPAISPPTNSLYECPCHLNNDNNDDCTSSPEMRNLSCWESTVCSPKLNVCYICCDDNLDTIEDGKSSKSTCEQIRCPQNYESKKSGRYYKKDSSNPKSKQSIV